MVKDIEDHPGFKACDDGTIIGKRGRPMIGHVDRCGYKEVMFSENGKCTNYLAHRLIAKTFVPNPDNLDYVNHKDGNKLNNSADNLEWCTRSYNTKHSFAHGLQRIVTNQYGTFSVLTNDQINQIKELFSQGMTDKEISKIIGCSRELIGRKIRNEGLR